MEKQPQLLEIMTTIVWKHPDYSVISSETDQLDIAEFTDCMP
jgi:hypothetical protein